MGLARLAATAGFALFAAGCATQSPIEPTRAYEGPSKQQDQVAVAECGFSAQIVAIDGNDEYQCRPLGDRFALPPGRHTFTVHLDPSAPGAGEQPTDPRQVSFQLQAGQTYDISAFAQPVAGKDWALVVTNRSTGEDLINPYHPRSVAKRSP
jgi:hypothetical protein